MNKKIIIESLVKVINESAQKTFADCKVGDNIYRVDMRDKSMTPETLKITDIDTRDIHYVNNNSFIQKTFIYLSDDSYITPEMEMSTSHQTIYDDYTQNRFHDNVLSIISPDDAVRFAKRYLRCLETRWR